MSVDIEILSLSNELQQLITVDQAWYFKIIPKSKSNSSIEFYSLAENCNDTTSNNLELALGKTIKLYAVEEATLLRSLTKHYRKNSNDRQNVVSANIATSKDEEGFLDALIAEAKNLGSSDIHIESYKSKYRIRMRIDGQLIERHKINDGERYDALINVIKMRSGMKIEERRLPQDSSFEYNKNGLKFDIRVSSIKTIYKEKIVLRLLGSDATNLDIRSLGFEEKQLNDYLDGIKRPEGILLISGPTGSGKTTTLYATLKLLNNTDTNILTIEDPVEYTLQGVNHIQVKEDIGLTFASALRSFLRQDPDVIMLGEIRDPETAQMAIKASLTGHLVLSTIHTNSAWGTVTRLADMGVEPYLIASSLSTSVAQRLVRLLCPACKKKQVFDPKQFPRTFKPTQVVNEHYTANGCDDCYHTGYSGRKAIYEVISIDPELADNIIRKNFDVSTLLRERGIRSIADSAFELFYSGKTSLDEIYPFLMSEF